MPTLTPIDGIAVGVAATLLCAALTGCASMHEPINRVDLTHYRGPTPQGVEIEPPHPPYSEGYVGQPPLHGAASAGTGALERRERPTVPETTGGHNGFNVGPPLRGLVVTSAFGDRRGVPAGAGGGGRHHLGVDLRADVGTPVMAPRSGVLSRVWRAAGYGLAVDIDHGGGWISRFAHLSRVLLERGARVEEGQIVAYSGSSGDASGPHLHWELRHRGRAVDPMQYLSNQ